jgi:hypothetical protein
MAVPIKIITIEQDKLVMDDREDLSNISLKSPWNTQPSDSLYNLVKLNVLEYAVLIVSSASKKE